MHWGSNYSTWTRKKSDMSPLNKSKNLRFQWCLNSQIWLGHISSQSSGHPFWYVCIRLQLRRVGSSTGAIIQRCNWQSGAQRCPWEPTIHNPLKANIRYQKIRWDKRRVCEKRERERERDGLLHHREK